MYAMILDFFKDSKIKIDIKKLQIKLKNKKGETLDDNAKTREKLV